MYTDTLRTASTGMLTYWSLSSVDCVRIIDGIWCELDFQVAYHPHGADQFIDIGPMFAALK